jgi:hypothetical protein
MAERMARHVLAKAGVPKNAFPGGSDFASQSAALNDNIIVVSNQLVTISRPYLHVS